MRIYEAYNEIKELCESQHWTIEEFISAAYKSHVCEIIDDQIEWEKENKD